MSTTPIWKENRKCDCKNHTHCLHCNKKMPKSTKSVNGYCLKCWASAADARDPNTDFADPTGFEVLKGRKNCVVLGCENWSDRGVFIGDLCSPCHSFIAKGEGQFSQAYRNSLQIMAHKFVMRMEYTLVTDLDPTKSIGRRGTYISGSELEKLT